MIEVRLLVSLFNLWFMNQTKFIKYFISINLLLSKTLTAKTSMRWLLTSQTPHL